MRDDILAQVPEERRDAARSALTDAFGRAPLAAPQAIQGGASGALIYRVEVADRPFLLRLETARDPFRNPHRGYPCMRIAAEAGVAPPLRHADPEAGVAIMDFLPQRPLAEVPGGPSGLLSALGLLVARLQATPTFPPLLDYPVVIERSLALVRGSGLFAEGLLDPHVQGLERIRAAYRWDGAAMVSSHNDLNPTNIIFDGDRLWLIDWEIAFRNDPLADVAILANNFAPTSDLRDALMRAWLGRAPDALLQARLLLMRQFARLFYACLTLSASIGKRPQETDLTTLSVAAFTEAVSQGRLTIGGPDTVHALGKMYLAGFLDGMKASEFQAALDIAGGD